VKLLLDTHIWLWSLSEPHRLSRRVHQELGDAKNELWLSPVSTWEALLLHAKGRIEFLGSVREWVTKATSHLREAPLTHEIVIAAEGSPLLHRDPADRFLAATAEILSLTLVTADQRLLGLGNISTLANR
jgi:PIN domain nuclease of toxin-antitoxin system